MCILKYFTNNGGLLFEQKLWNQIKKTLQTSFNQKKSLHSILNSVTLESHILNGKTHLTLNVPSSYHQRVIKKYLPNIQGHFKTQGVLYNTINIQKILKNINTTNNISSPVILPKSPSLIPNTSYGITKKTNFLSNWTFSSFIQGPTNCFACSLAKSVATNPFKKNINPLFIYGPSGVGKTHLLHAIGNTLEKEKPTLKIRYLPAERFFNECISFIRKGEMSQFRQKYRTNTDVLLLDDVQILGRGNSIQEEFFYTFESLKQSGCQIILASDQKPKNIKGLKERIKTRFEGGIVVDMQIPDKDIKIAIIKNKALSLKLNISEDIVLYLSNIPTDSIRELEGHLNKIKMFCELQKTKFSLALARQMFCEEISSSLNNKTSLKNSASNNLKINFLQKKVCSQYNIKISELKSKSRDRNLVQARNLIMYIARKHLKCSLVEIGSYFGNRNHSTVLNGIKNIDIQQQQNPNLSKKINELKSFINK